MKYVLKSILKALRAICAGSDSNGYLGCFADIINSGNRDISGLGITNTNTQGGGSVDSCITYCKSLNYKYAGVQSG